MSSQYPFAIAVERIEYWMDEGLCIPLSLVKKMDNYEEGMVFEIKIGSKAIRLLKWNTDEEPNKCLSTDGGKTFTFECYADESGDYIIDDTYVAMEEDFKLHGKPFDVVVVPTQIRLIPLDFD